MLIIAIQERLDNVSKLASNFHEDAQHTGADVVCRNDEKRERERGERGIEWRMKKKNNGETRMERGNGKRNMVGGGAGRRVREIRRYARRVRLSPWHSRTV